MAGRTPEDPEDVRRWVAGFPILCNPSSVPTLQMRKPRPAGTAQSKAIGSRARAPIPRLPVAAVLRRLLWNVRSQPWSGSCSQARAARVPTCSVGPQGVTVARRRSIWLRGLQREPGHALRTVCRWGWGFAALERLRGNTSEMRCRAAVLSAGSWGALHCVSPVTRLLLSSAHTLQASVSRGGTGWGWGRAGGSFSGSGASLCPSPCKPSGERPQHWWQVLPAPL